MRLGPSQTVQVHKEMVLKRVSEGVAGEGGETGLGLECFKVEKGDPFSESCLLGQVSRAQP